MNKWNEFKALLYNGKINKKHLFQALKNDYTFEEQKSLLSKTPTIFNGLIHGNIFPKGYNSIGYNERSSSVNLQIEINWIINEVLKYSNEINDFIINKIEFEKKVLIGRYVESENVLNKIESEISKSYWGIESKLIQLKNEKGIEGIIEYYNQIKELESKDPAYYFLSSYFFYKIEDDVTIISYQKELNNLRNKLEDDNDYREYFEYRLNHFEYIYNNFERSLWVASIHPIIDKYLLLRDYIAHICSKPDFDFSDTLFLSQLNLIAKEISDPLINKSLQLSNISKIKISKDKSLFDVYDLYTQGQYEEVINQLDKLLFSNPSNSSLSILYIKSLHHLKREYAIPLELENTILGSIMYQLYRFMDRGEESGEALIELMTISNGIQSFDFAKQLMSFLENFFYETNENIFSKKAYFFTREDNIFDYKIFNTNQSKKEYLDKYDNVVTADFFKSLLDDLNRLEESENIPKERLLHYKALFLNERGEHKKAEPILEEALKYSDNINFIYEKILISLFECYIKLDKFGKAINLYVDNYLKNVNLLKQIEIKKIALKIAKTYRFKNVETNDINISIFIALSDIDTSNIYVSYNLFLKSLAVKKPSEMEKYFTSINKGKLIVFLKLVCSTKVLSRSVLVFKTSIQVLEERLLINQILIKLDSDNQEDYSREITKLTRDLNVQKRKKEIDQSKIHVDEFGLSNSELKQIKKGFDRYRNISEILKVSSFEGVGIEASSLIKLLLGEIDSTTYQESVKKTDYQFTIFRQLYIDIRDKFLFSDKFGLDYYLSTRIRHGTIEGQLRRSFNNTRIITNRSKEKGVYVDDTLWSKKLGLKGAKNKEFQKRIKSFSQNIDDIILELKNDCIQIKTEDPNTSNKGWFEFGYYYHTDVYNKLYTNKCQYISDFDELVLTVLDYLWELTEISLNIIRNAINYSVRDYILEEIDAFEKEIRDILGEIDCKDLFTQITNCRTSVQKDIDKVAAWFKRSKSFDIDFIIDDVVASSLDTINNIDPDNKLILKENINFTGLLKGKYFTHFDDLLKIFFNNIVAYMLAGEKEIIKSEITIFEEKNYLKIIITNSLKENTNEEEFKKLIAEKFEKVHTIAGLREEGNSGLIKASNIISNVFRDSSNEINAIVENKKIKINCSIALKNLIVS
jgi:hypothetical protein